MLDPLAQIRADAQNAIAAQRSARPSQAPGNVLPGSLPGQPGYNNRIPPPDGPAMGEVPDGSGTASPESQFAGLPYAQQAVPAGLLPVSPRRVVVYCGRGEDFVVSVEESADDEAIYSKKYDLSTLMPILDVVRALGVKVIDRTGGELASYEGNLRSRPAQRAAGPPANGKAGPREPSNWEEVPFDAGAE